MKKARLLSFILLAFLSCAAAMLGLGLAYQRYSAMIANQGAFQGVSTDGWVVDGARLSFPYLAERGNRLHLRFNTWRPEVPPTQLKVKVCGSDAGEYLVQAGTELLISLRGDCPDRRTEIQVVNPFQISPDDARQLGAQLLEAKVTSRLGIAIIAPSLAAAVGLAIFILALLCYFAFDSQKYRNLAWLIPLIVWIPLRRADLRDLAPPFWLWATFTCVLGGFVFARFFANKDLQSSQHRQLKNSTCTLLLMLVLAVGAALRFYCLNFGLPFNYHPDEIPKANAIMQMVHSHSLNPRYFLHPSLLLYSTYLVNTIFHWVWLDGDFRASAFLAGRTVSALAGCGSLLLLYCIGARLYSRSTGLLAAAILAVLPLHVTCSRYLKEDSLLLFFILACFLAVLKAVQEDKKMFLLLAGVLAGLSASTKYSGLLTSAIVMMAPWLRSKSFKPDWGYAKITVAALALVPLAFLGGSPYVVLDYPKFISDFNYERSHMLRGHTQSIDAWSQFWMYHLSRSILPGVSTVTSMIALCGCGLLLWRRRVEDLVLLALILAFYLPAEWVKAKPAPQPERYIFPCLPFLALAAAQCIEFISWTRLKRFAPALACIAIAFPALRSFTLAREMRTDTRVQVAQWIRENVPPGSKVLFDWQPYSPALSPKEYSIEYILRINVPQRLTPAALKKSDADYLVLSSLFYDRYFSQPNPNRVFQGRFKAVFTRVPVVKEFRAASGTYGFHNPTLTVFSLKDEDFAKLGEQLEQKRAGKIEQTSNDERSSLRWSIP
ncbi:MAG: glycosyltransferase family 39 protein [Deltaproteobacteria bacterium]|nr:glycosyltransferase family 39 protein [Deltaproteobacteria bacterium]